MASHGCDNYAQYCPIFSETEISDLPLKAFPVLAERIMEVKVAKRQGPVDLLRMMCLLSHFKIRVLQPQPTA